MPKNILFIFLYEAGTTSFIIIKTLTMIRTVKSKIVNTFY